MTQFKFIEWQNDGTTVTVWLNRAPVNVVNSQM